MTNGGNGNDGLSGLDRDTDSDRLIGGLRYVPAVALGLDLVMITIAVFVAAVAGDALPFSTLPARRSTAPARASPGPLIILGWVAGHRRSSAAYRGRSSAPASTSTSASSTPPWPPPPWSASPATSLKFPLSRGFFVLTFVVGIPLLVAGALLLRRSVHRARRLGALQHRVVIAGSEGHVDEIASVLHRESWLGYNVIGALVPDLGEQVDDPLGHSAARAPQSVAQVGHRRRVPTSSSSPAARSAPPPTCAGWPGISSTRTSRWSSRRA